MKPTYQPTAATYAPSWRGLSTPRITSPRANLATSSHKGTSKCLRSIEHTSTQCRHARCNARVNLQRIDNVCNSFPRCARVAQHPTSHLAVHPTLYCGRFGAFVRKVNSWWAPGYLYPLVKHWKLLSVTAAARGHDYHSEPCWQEASRIDHRPAFISIAFARTPGNCRCVSVFSVQSTVSPSSDPHNRANVATAARSPSAHWKRCLAYDRTARFRSDRVANFRASPVIESPSTNRWPRALKLAQLEVSSSFQWGPSWPHINRTCQSFVRARLQTR